MLDAADLPDDVAALKAMLIAARLSEAGKDAQIGRKDERIERLEKLVAAFKQAAFGRKSEKTDPDQFDLALEDLETAMAAIHAEDEADGPPGNRISKPRETNRGSLPRHLPRVEEVIEPASLICACGGCLHCIGEDVSERLDVVPAQFRVIVTRRPKYACRACTDGVVQAPAPARLIQAGLPTEATVAHVLVSKYADHLPLYRQAQIMSRQGIDLDRSTLADWVGRAAFELRPVFDALVADLKRSTKLFMDETRAPVLDPGSRKTKTGYFWALARDDRTWGGGAPPGVAFTYAPGRGGIHAERILQGFSGILQVDGYAGYNRLIAPERVGSHIRLAYCWAHARRKLVEITRNGSAPIAEDGVKQIGELYRIEAELRGRDPQARLAGRQERSAPLVADMQTWLVDHRAHVSTKSPLGEALAYIAKYWDGLKLFLTDGRIEIDNNAVERTIRPIALNRKNALFAGHDTGAENWATIASLIETCKLNAVDPQAYLTATLTAIVSGHKQSRIEELLPWKAPRR
ncbi:IS66 family transposase [Rhizobium leguminosarum]|uniref:IS66 family transposase n=1 Tax=Rhizobium leguminosarum TaxID=384 RepID=UPI001C9864CA|nr:IS66 family transposase [Rhizobium leguminosarum]MBY5624886.1 IS66 family transposase [Rhizobium leguminosarum]MBY5645799.1 IS66 family transposase [Rhizobium leguminosarum]